MCARCVRRVFGLSVMALCGLGLTAGCAVPTEANTVVGRYVSRGSDPPIELRILPTHIFEEQLGSRKVIGRWEIVTSLSDVPHGRAMSPDSGMHLTGLIEAPSDVQTNERSYGVLRRSWKGLVLEINGPIKMLLGKLDDG